MVEMDDLPESVRGALRVLDGEAVCTCSVAYTSRGMKDPQCNHDLAEDVNIISAELLRLASRVKELERLLLDARSVSDRWSAQCEQSESELAALKARIAEAPTHVAEWTLAHGLTFNAADGTLDGRRVAMLDMGKEG